MLCVAADGALKANPPAAGLVDDATRWTGPARVLGDYQFHSDACEVSLVGDELIEPVEAPGMKRTAAILAIPFTAHPDAGQILHANRADAASDAPVHDLAADLVILVLHPKGFLVLHAADSA